MLTPDEIRTRLSDRNIRAVAVGAGLHPNTVYAFVRGDTEPTYETVKRLSDYLTDKGDA